MTPESKMQKIVEAAGECWHDTKTTEDIIGCLKCQTLIDEDDHQPNPSPTDLNELFRLAGEIQPDIWLKVWFGKERLEGFSSVTNIKELAESILNELFESLKSEE